MNISETISKQRKMKKLTQKDIADKLGLSVQSISKWENGVATPTIENCYELSQILDLPLEILLEGDNTFMYKLSLKDEDKKALAQAYNLPLDCTIDSIEIPFFLKRLYDNLRCYNPSYTLLEYIKDIVLPFHISNPLGTNVKLNGGINMKIHNTIKKELDLSKVIINSQKDTSNYEPYNDNKTKKHSKFGDIYENTLSLILGKNTKKYIKSDERINVLCIGSSGSGKTRYFVKPNIENTNENIVYIGGLNFNSNQEFLSFTNSSNKKNIQNINMFDTKEENLIKYNPLSHIFNESQVFSFVEQFVKNTLRENDKDDEFWILSSKDVLLNALLNILNTTKDFSYNNIEKVITNYNHNMSKETFNSIVANLLVALKPLSYIESINAKEIDFEVLRKDNQIICLKINPFDDAYSFINSIFVNQLHEYIMLNDIKPLHLIIDEFGNIPSFPIDKYLENSRKYNEHISLVVQSIGQLKYTYNNNKLAKILDAIDILLLLGTSDADTVDYFVKIGEDISKNNKKASRLLNAKEIMRMGRDKELIIFNNTVTLDDKY